MHSCIHVHVNFNTLSFSCLNSLLNYMYCTRMFFMFSVTNTSCSIVSNFIKLCRSSTQGWKPLQKVHVWYMYILIYTTCSTSTLILPHFFKRENNYLSYDYHCNFHVHVDFSEHFNSLASFSVGQNSSDLFSALVRQIPYLDFHVVSHRYTISAFWFFRRSSVGH